MDYNAPTYEIGSLGELVQHLYPEVYRLVVHSPQLRVQLHLVNAECDALDSGGEQLLKSS